MKTTILNLTIMLFSLVSTVSLAQTADQKAVKHTVQQFMKAGDQNDAETLEQLLATDYRVVMNQLFDSKEVNILPREVYIQKIASKEFGGDKRSLTFHEVIVNGNNAVVNITSKGEKASMQSILVLVKNASNQWQLMSDTPVFL